jgi:hypothetical protein
MIPVPPKMCPIERRPPGRGLRPLLSLCGALGLTALLHAQLVVPAGYSITTPEGTAQGGTYDYFDDTGTQLTDGVFGGNLWYDDLDGPGPHGNAYEWVAWVAVEPSLTFNFSKPVSIQSVTIGFSRGSGGGVYLPANVTIAGQPFSLTGNEFADDLRQDLTFTLTSPFVGTDLTIDLSDGNAGAWIFLDEVQFTAVPEPASVWLAGLAGVAVIGWRRRPRA